ncbi:MAG: hypothetical protein U0Y10_12045 [Spirosomataceae bacterium]
MKQLQILIYLFVATTVFAQTPTDGLMMGKGLNCSVLSYGKSTWEYYWEGSLYRNNENIGKFTGQNVMFMNNYGISNRLNVIVGVPYIWTQASNGNLAGHRDVQDFSAWLKYKALDLKVGENKFAGFVTVGASVPTHHYKNEMLPFAVGMGAKTASVRAALHFKTKIGFYVTGQAGYTLKGDATLDRDSYQYDGKVYPTNVVPVPDVADMTGRIGFLNKRVQVEGFYDYFTCVSGDNIRRQDMPFMTNKMMATSIGAMAKVNWYTSVGMFTLAGQYSRILSGRNVGDATMRSIAIQYTIRLKKVDQK